MASKGETRGTRMMFLMTVLMGNNREPAHNKKEDQNHADIVLEQLLYQLANAENGDKTALGEIYEHIRVPVYAYALSILKNPYDAEDALHDALLCLYQAVDRYRPDGKPMAWILTITRNLCYQKLRSQKHTADLPEEAWDRYLDSAEEVTVEDRVVLRQCMARLSEEEQEILVMHAVADMKHRQIAEVMDLPLSTVLAKYHRALKKLRKEMH